ncbi:unnamed protein product [Meloidogyne enterolobii]|uniref:Uncharacterized protein n=1 Tax=Meloidogyne enterolobii TaxID=390850 RepID=A0ACB0YIE3_MELEN
MTQVPIKKMAGLRPTSYNYEKKDEYKKPEENYEKPTYEKPAYEKKDNYEKTNEGYNKEGYGDNKGYDKEGYEKGYGDNGGYAGNEGYEKGYGEKEGYNKESYGDNEGYDKGYGYNEGYNEEKGYGGYDEGYEGKSYEDNKGYKKKKYRGHKIRYGGYGGYNGHEKYGSSSSESDDYIYLRNYKFPHYYGNYMNYMQPGMYYNRPIYYYTTTSTTTTTTTTTPTTTTEETTTTSEDTTTQEETTPTPEDTTTQGETTPTPEDTTPTPEDTTPTPEDTTTQEETTPTPEDTTTQEETTPTPEDTTPTPEDTTTPEETTLLPEDTTPPQEDTTPPAEDTTPPSEDTTPASEDTTPPAEDTTPPSEETTESTSDGTIETNSEETSTITPGSDATPVSDETRTDLTTLITPVSDETRTDLTTPIGTEGTPPTPKPPCPPDYEFFKEGNCCILISSPEKKPLTWKEASDEAKKNGALMASIHFKKEDDFIRNLVEKQPKGQGKDNPVYFTGLQVNATNGKIDKFAWSDNTRPNTDPWGPKTTFNGNNGFGGISKDPSGKASWGLYDPNQKGGYVWKIDLSKKDGGTKGPEPGTPTGGVGPVGNNGLPAGFKCTTGCNPSSIKLKAEKGQPSPVDEGPEEKNGCQTDVLSCTTNQPIATITFGTNGSLKANNFDKKNVRAKLICANEEATGKKGWVRNGVINNPKLFFVEEVKWGKRKFNYFSVLRHIVNNSQVK